MYQLGFILGAVMIVMGVLLVSGSLGFSGGPSPTLRVVFGVVVVLFGIYRIAITAAERQRRRRAARPTDDDEPIEP